MQTRVMLRPGRYRMVDLPSGPPPEAAIGPACMLRGGPTGDTVLCGTCPLRPRLKVFGCVVHGTCTLKDCDACPSRLPEVPASAGRLEWISTARLARDAVTLAGMLPANCAGVIGIPRSGMLPAAVIATHLHLPLYELTASGPRRMGQGGRGSRAGGGPVAVVDDSVYSGAALARARALCGKARVVACAVYCRPERMAAADLFARQLPSPHLMEWNLFNNGPLTGHAEDPVLGAGVATDLDGVILHDDASGGRPGTPYLVPRREAVPLIATGRHERHRAGTEAGLQRWGVRWARLEMLPDAVPLTPEAAAEHKARHYAASACGLFVESDPAQAERIHALTGRPVACPREERVYQS